MTEQRTRVYLSLGSNIDREQNFRTAIGSLRAAFGTVELSPVYESEAVGFDGEPFFNMIVAIETELSLSELSRRLKSIEDSQGRDRSAPKFAPRTLDIDIVTYGNCIGVHHGIELPRPELYYNAFVLQPFADLAPDFMDENSGKAMSDLWADYDGAQSLWRVDLSLDL